MTVRQGGWGGTKEKKKKWKAYPKSEKAGNKEAKEGRRDFEVTEKEG